MESRILYGNNIITVLLLNQNVLIAEDLVDRHGTDQYTEDLADMCHG